MADSREVTELLAAARQGEKGAVEALFPLVYAELRRLAHGQLRRGGPNLTLNTTAMVHEAYIKLVDQTRVEWSDRGHFMAVAATAMRHILVDAARRRTAQKRGGGAARQTWLEDGAIGAIDAQADEILAVDQALHRLGEVNDRLSRLVELRFFGGLTVEETAKTLEISARTVKRDWRVARAFLYRELSSAEGA